MSAKPIFSLQLKAKPSIAPAGDSRPWGIDVYGMHDNYSIPIENTSSGPLGPPDIATDAGSTGDFAPCLLPTLSRLQYFDSSSGIWKRLAGDGSGVNVNVANQPSVSVLSLPPQVGGSFDLVTTTVDTSSTVIASATPSTSYMRIDVAAGAGNLWVNLAGAAAVLNAGVLVTPSAPLVLQWPTAPNTDIFAIATAVGTVCNVSIRS